MAITITSKQTGVQHTVGCLAHTWNRRNFRQYFSQSTECDRWDARRAAGELDPRVGGRRRVRAQRERHEDTLRKYLEERDRLEAAEKVASWAAPSPWDDLPDTPDEHNPEL